MPQFFVDKKLVDGNEIELRGSDARHVSLSLRLKVGDTLIVSDGSGNSFESKIVSAAPTKVVLQITGKLSKKELSPPPVIAISMIKADRFEWALQKCVELGIKRFIPLFTERTAEHCKDSSSKKSLRWQKILTEAAKQSGLSFIPQISEACSIASLLDKGADYASIVIPHEGECALDARGFWKNRKVPAREDLILIGPEGGFTPDEIDNSTECGATIISLGSQILRAETAAVVASTIWQYELGNLSL